MHNKLPLECNNGTESQSITENNTDILYLIFVAT